MHLNSAGYDTVSYLGYDEESLTVYAARFRANPFSIVAFEFYNIKSELLLSNEDIDGIGWVLQHVTRWRELDINSHVLLSEEMTAHDWTQAFMCFERDVSGKKITSMCGPVNDKYYITPIDSSVKLFTTGLHRDISRKLSMNPVGSSIERTVPMKDIWDWRNAVIVAHMYKNGMFEIKKEKSGRSLIFF